MRLYAQPKGVQQNNQELLNALTLPEESETLVGPTSQVTLSNRNTR